MLDSSPAYKLSDLFGKTNCYQSWFSRKQRGEKSRKKKEKVYTKYLLGKSNVKFFSLVIGSL